MLEDDQKQTPNETLEYASPRHHRKKPLQLRTMITILVIGLLSLVIVILMLVGIIELPIAVVGIFLVVILSFAINTILAGVMNKESAGDEEDDDRKWKEHEARKREMVEIAKKVYAKGPIGSWRFIVVEYRRTLPIILDERVLQFEMDGKGRYLWHRRGDFPLHFETIFEYKLDQEGCLTVQISSPPIEGWNPVEFGFESRRDKNGDLDLFLWFESKNPLTQDFKEYWPFWGDFQRSAQ